MTALNFDSNTDDYMWNDLDLFMGGVSGYTVLMVLSPNSIYGNDDAIDNNALWGPDDDRRSLGDVHGQGPGGLDDHRGAAATRWGWRSGTG